MAQEAPARCFVAGPHAQRELVDDLGIAQVRKGPSLRLNVVAVEPTGKQEFSCEGFRLDFFNVPPLGRPEETPL